MQHILSTKLCVKPRELVFPPLSFWGSIHGAEAETQALREKKKSCSGTC